MTDKEIMEALDCCDNCFCDRCCYRHKLLYCREELCKDALALINRQKTELENYSHNIKQLTKEIMAMNEFNKRLSRTVKLERVEAIKEFAEMLKGDWYVNRYESPDVDFNDYIDDLVKEMTEKKDNACKID